MMLLSKVPIRFASSVKSVFKPINFKHKINAANDVPGIASAARTKPTFSKRWAPPKGAAANYEGLRRRGSDTRRHSEFLEDETHVIRYPVKPSHSFSSAVYDYGDDDTVNDGDDDRAARSAHGRHDRDGKRRSEAHRVDKHERPETGGRAEGGATGHLRSHAWRREEDGHESDGGRIAEGRAADRGTQQHSGMNEPRYGNRRRRDEIGHTDADRNHNRKLDGRIDNRNKDDNRKVYRRTKKDIQSGLSGSSYTTSSGAPLRDLCPSSSAEELVYGIYPVLLALQAGRRTVRKVITKQGLENANHKIKMIHDIAREKNIEIVSVERRDMRRIFQDEVVHQNVYCLASVLPVTPYTKREAMGGAVSSARSPAGELSAEELQQQSPFHAGDGSLSETSSIEGAVSEGGLKSLSLVDSRQESHPTNVPTNSTLVGNSLAALAPRVTDLHSSSIQYEEDISSNNTAVASVLNTTSNSSTNSSVASASNTTSSSAGRKQLWLLLDHVVDVMNMGAVLRSSCYFGVSKVLVTKSSSSINGAVSKASSGAAELLPVNKLHSPVATLKALQARGWQVVTAVAAATSDDCAAPHSDTDALADDHYHTSDTSTARVLSDDAVEKRAGALTERGDATHVTSSAARASTPRVVPVIPADAFKMTQDTILIVGNEGKGISSKLSALADLSVTIPPTGPLAPHVGCLNVSVATAILLHSVTRSSGGE